MIRGKVSDSTLQRSADHAAGLLDSVIPFTLIARRRRRSIAASLVLVSTMPETPSIATIVLPDERLAPVRLFGIPLGFLAGSTHRR
jgi:hypothetical protein